MEGRAHCQRSSIFNAVPCAGSHSIPRLKSRLCYWDFKNQVESSVQSHYKQLSISSYCAFQFFQNNQKSWQVSFKCTVLLCRNKFLGGFTFISFETSPQDSLIPSSMSSVNSLSLLTWQRICYYISHTKKKKKKSAYFSSLSLYYILLHLPRFQVREAHLLKKTWQHMFSFKHVLSKSHCTPTHD